MPAPILKDKAVNARWDLSFGSVPVSVDRVLVTPQGRMPGSGPLSTSRSIVGDTVQLTLIGGTDGERYDVAVRVNHADGSASERGQDGRNGGSVLVERTLWSRGRISARECRTAGIPPGAL